MHRIDSSTATPDNRFTSGDPTIPVPATTVTAEWLNSVQEELVAILTAAGITPNKVSNVQVLSAILDLIADSTPGIATALKNGICRPDGVTITVDSTGKLTSVPVVYKNAGDCDLFDPGFYICDNSAETMSHAPTTGVFVLWKKGLKSNGGWLLYDHAVSFENIVHTWHRAFVLSRGTWSSWEDKIYIPSYSKVYRSQSALDARLALQAATGYDNVTIWPSGGKLMVSKNSGDTTTEVSSLSLDPSAGTINGILPAPRPTAANFVTCGATLPAGGTWVYCITCWNSTGYYIQTYSGVAAGGTTVAGGANYYSGFGWRVA